MRAGLDAEALRRLASPRLEIGLPPSEQIVDAAKSLGRWEQDRVPAPSPDLVAAELLRQVLLDRPDLASEWLWETLNDPVAIEVQRLDRLAYDNVTLHGPGENVLVQKLVQGVADILRAKTWRVFLDSAELGFRLNPVGTTVAKSLLADPELPEEERAVILNNLSVRMSDAGDRSGALTAIREAVETYRRLGQENPARFAPDLALSLNDLSAELSDAGDQAAALTAIREAVEIRRPLAQENPARFAPDLAMSLNNLSNLLGAAGDRAEALTTIREATEVYRRLAQENPVRFAPDLALSLNHLSNRLRDVGDGPGALTAIHEAVEIRRRLANPPPKAGEGMGGASARLRPSC